MADQCNQPAQKVPGDQDLLQPWFPVIRQARGQFCGGPGIYSIRILVDEDGRIAAQFVDYARLAPRSTSADAIIRIGDTPEKLALILSLMTS